MPIFELTPNNVELPDWEASTHRGPCRVSAPDSHAARRFAQQKFINTANHGQYRGQRKIFCPWTDQSLVRCQQVRGEDPGFLEEGFVQLRGEQGWVAPSPAVSGNGVSTTTDAATVIDQNGTSVPPPLTDIIARALQNQEELAHQAKGLLRVLEEITAPQSVAGADNSPMPSPSASEFRDVELVELLQQTRDELRQLNATLDGAPNCKNDSPSGLAGLQASVAALRKSLGGLF